MMDDIRPQPGAQPMRALLAATVALCAAAPLPPQHVLLQREYFDAWHSNPYGVVTCGFSYDKRGGEHDRKRVLGVGTTQFQDQATGATQTAGPGVVPFEAQGDWLAPVKAAIEAALPFQPNALDGSCPVAATARTLLVAYHGHGQGHTILAVRCETATGAVTGATTAAGTYLARLMFGAVPACKGLDGADFSTVPIQ